MDTKILTDIFYQSIGSFAIVEFKASNGSNITAIGILREVDRSSGDILIIHRDTPGKVWGLNVSHVVSYHFEPLKELNKEEEQG